MCRIKQILTYLGLFNDRHMGVWELHSSTSQGLDPQ
jgi:hypothetical protein